MIKIEHIETYSWEAVIRGMRNPLESWEKSDSSFYSKDGEAALGENDYKLMKNLWKAGEADRKYLRMMDVTADVTAPLYWWKEFDTYKVGTVANSCSTMHCIMKKEFTMDDFSHEHLGVHAKNEGEDVYLDLWEGAMEDIVRDLNIARARYIAYDNQDMKKQFWWQIIQLLPSSYNQKRTVHLNYEVLAHMWNDRKNHKLDEWRNFLRFMEVNLPYSEFITGKFEE